MMMSARFFHAALVLTFLVTPDLVWGRLTNPSSRLLNQGTCPDGTACSSDTDCYACSNNRSSCSPDNGNDDCKGRATCSTGVTGSCELGGGGGGGSGTCSQDSSVSCSIDSDCGTCACGRNDGQLCSSANCNQGGGNCVQNTCDTGSPPVTSSPSTSPPVTSPPVTSSPSASPPGPSSFPTACGGDETNTILITGASKNAYDNGEYYIFGSNEFPNNGLGIIQGNNPPATVYFEQTSGFNHPFRLCVNGMIGNGIECVGDQVNPNAPTLANPCLTVTLPTGSDTLWYVCEIDNHKMENQIYPAAR